MYGISGYCFSETASTYDIFCLPSAEGESSASFRSVIVHTLITARAHVGLKSQQAAPVETRYRVNADAMDQKVDFRCYCSRCLPRDRFQMRSRTARPLDIDIRHARYRHSRSCLRSIQAHVRDFRRTSRRRFEIAFEHAFSFISICTFPHFLQTVKNVYLSLVENGTPNGRETLRESALSFALLVPVHDDNAAARSLETP